MSVSSKLSNIFTKKLYHWYFEGSLIHLYSGPYFVSRSRLYRSCFWVVCVVFDFLIETSKKDIYSSSLSTTFIISYIFTECVFVHFLSQPFVGSIKTTLRLDRNYQRASILWFCYKYIRFFLKRNSLL